MKAKKDLLFPIRLGETETGSAIRASCVSTARVMLRKQKPKGDYYLGNPVPYAANASEYVVLETVTVGEQRLAFHHASPASMAKQKAALRQCGGD